MAETISSVVSSLAAMMLKEQFEPETTETDLVDEILAGVEKLLGQHSGR